MAGEGDAERLVVLLEARIRDFEKNMAKASGTATRSYGGMRRDSATATQRMEADMVRATGSMNRALDVTGAKMRGFVKAGFGGFVIGAAGAVAGALSLRAVINGTKDALDRFGDIADKSAAAGVDAEFFQGIAYAASLSGVEVDGVASALATFAKNAGLAAEGKGRMVTALQALNPELLKNIQAATTQEARIRLAADAISEARDAAQAAAIASALFGDQGTKLVAAFRGGADQIDAMMEKARGLGIIVDRDLIAQADELGDQFDTASQIVDLKLKKAFINAAPSLVYLTDLAGMLAESLNIAVDQFKAIEDRSFVKPLQNQLASLYNQRAELGDSIESFKNEIASLGDTGSAGMMNQQLAGMQENFDALTGQADRLLSRITELEGRPRTGTAPNTPLAPPKPPAIDDLGEGGGKWSSFADTFDVPSKAAARATIEHANAVKDLIESLEFERSMLGMSEVEQAKMNALRQAGADATDAQRIKIGEIIDTTFAEQDRIKALQAQFDEFGQIGQSAVEGIVDALDDGAVSAQEFQDILKSALKQAANFFLGQAFNSFGGFFGPMLGLPGRANGGPVTAGQPYIVGERRPEVFVPDQSGRILPSVPSAPVARGSGQSRDAMHITVGVAANDDGTFRAYVQNVVRSSAPGIIQAARALAAKDAPGVLASYQQQRRGSDHRVR